MRTRLPLLGALLCLIPLFSKAQCPPAGFPQPGNTCATAPILCENLDGYCATINNNNTAQGFPGCPGWFLNNDEWFGFFAGSTTITVVVTPSNCSPGSNMGLQAGIYAACTSQPMDLQCSCTTNPFTLTATNFVVGQIYYFVLDGCGGNVCDYSIDVTQGSTVGVPPATPGAITGPVTACAGTSSAYSIAAVTAATMYNWTLVPPLGTVTGSGTNININWAANASGPVQLCVTASNACYSNPVPSCIDIEVVPRPTATISGSGLLCAGASTPVNLSVAFTGTGPWTFVHTRNGTPQAPITTSDNPYTLAVTQPGTYALQSVTTPPNNCPGTVSGSAVVTQVTLTPTSSITNAVCGQSNGNVDLSVSGGGTPYTYNWSGGETTQDLTGVPAGTYTVTITDNNGCTATHVATVTNQTISINITGTVTNNTTCMGGNGSINTTITPAGTYVIDWSNGGTTQNQTNLTPGTYIITVTSGVSCTQTASFTVLDQPNTPTITFAVTNTTCELPNGAINVTVSGGVAPYTYNWDTGQTVEDLTNLLAGTYGLTVTGANGCTQTATITVNNTNPTFTITPTIVSNTNCNGVGNGSITLAVAPAGTYTYAWDNGNTTNSITNQLPGSYGVTVSAGGACTSAQTYTIPDQPNTPTITFVVTNTTCELPNGAINVTVSGGVTPYTYNWGSGQTTQDLSMILAGTYDLTVTGGNGCTQTASISVNNTNPSFNINPTIVANSNCNGIGNGSINVTVTPAGTYTYLWSTTATTPGITGLLPGVYTITVSAGGACVQTLDITVPDNPNIPNITFAITPSTCDLANGAINVTVNGGVTPYTYAWSSGQSTQDLSNILAGDYSITVTGANGCTNSADITVPNNNPPFNVNPTIFPNTSCNSNGTGSVSLTVTPPGAYTYTWSNGSTNSTVTQLPAGSISVTVSAGGTCIQTLDLNIPDQPITPNLSFSIIDASCGLSNGSVNLSVGGGVPPYTYSWSNTATTQDLSNVPADFYVVTVTGNNGCTEVGLAQVNDVPVFINVGATIIHNTRCIPPFNGRITLNLTPSNMTILWSNNSTASVLNNLAPGDYTVTVSAGGNCTETVTFTVDDNSESPALTLDVTPAICGLPNGAIDLFPELGIAPYTYKWSNNAMTQDLNNLPAGDYTVTVTTAAGCTEVSTVNVPDNDEPIIIYSLVDANTRCFAPYNGTIDLDFGPPNYTFTIQWSHSTTTQTYLTTLAPGTYTVTVTLGTCTASETFDILNNATPPNLALSATASICGQNSGSATVVATGGETPYTYKWSNMASTATINNLAPGTYTVTVTGFNACTAVSSVTVLNNTISPNITAAIVSNTSCSNSNGSIALTVTPATTYTYAWSNSANTATINNLAEGTYTVTVSAGAGCTASAVWVVDRNTTDPVLTDVVTPDICNQGIGVINLTASGSTAPYLFAWSNLAITEDLSSLFAGAYTVTVTDANGCTAVSAISVANNSSTFTLDGVIAALTDCATPNGSINLTVTPSGPYVYAWSNMATTEDVSGLPAGTYTVTVTEVGTCSGFVTFIIDDNRVSPTVSQFVNPELCGLSNGSVDLTVNGGLAPYTYLWSNTQTTEDIGNLAAGAYSVLVTDANNCTASSSANLPNNSIAFSVSGTSTDNSACDVNNGSIDVSVTPAGTYSYQWSNTPTTQDLNGISGGIYSVTVSAGGICTNVATFNILDNTLSPSVNGVISAAFCAKSNGGIDLNVSGGQGPFTYVWSNTSITEDISAVAAGDFTVTVTGANGCTSVEQFTVPDNAFSPSVTGALVENTSCTNPNGSISLSVTPADTYTFMWGTGQSTATLNGLTPGTYTVTVSAGGACTAVTDFLIGNNTPSPVLNAVVNTAFCSKPNGSIDLTVTGPSPAATYSWSNMAQTEDVSSLLSGTYTVTVTAVNGCTSTDSYIIGNQSNNFVVSEGITPNTACVGTNGGINITVLPAGTFTYQWSNSAQTEDLVNITPGTYTLTVTDPTGCSIANTFVVANASVIPSVTGAVTNILCFGQNTGDISLTVNNATAPLNFNWSPAQPGNPQNLNNITAGNYALTLTDALGCSTSANFAVIQPNNPLQLACAATTTISQPGATDGGGAVTLTGGTAPYTLTWTPGSTANNVGPGVFPINNLGEGSYAVAITDANGCTQMCGFNVGLVNCTTAVGSMSPNLLERCGAGCLSANYSPFGQSLDPDDALQFILHEGSSNQIVNELARSNQPSFCFDANSMSFGQTYYISAVAGTAGANGTVILTDYCTVVSFGTPIIFKPQPNASIQPPLKLNCAIQQVALNGQSDLPGSTFNWYTNASGQIIGNVNQSSVQASAPSTYFFVANLNGCADTSQVQVLDISNQPNATIQASPDDILDCKIDEIILAGVVEGTTAPNLVWLSNGVVYATGTTIQINTPALYTFILVDTITACADTATIQITENSQYPSLFVNPSNILTCAQPSVTLSGGSPFAGIQFKWLRINGTDTLTIGTGASIVVSAPGTYYFAGTDPINGCINAIPTVVTADQQYPVADAGAPFSIECFGELAKLDGTNSSGLPGLLFKWATSNGQIVGGNTTATPTINLPGAYLLTVTNPGNGCSDTDEVLISPKSPIPHLTLRQPPCVGDKGLMRIDSVTGGAPPVRYSLNNQPFTTQTLFANLLPGAYTLELVDANGCTAETSFNIDVPEVFDFSVLTDTLIRLGDSILIVITPSVAQNQIASIQWSPSTGLSCDTCLATIAAPGYTTRYQIQLVSIKGCKDQAYARVRVNRQLDIFAPNIIAPNSDQNNSFTLFTDPALNIQIKSMQVFSRWGELVFEQFNFLPNNPSLGWNGAHRGTELTPAVFVWQAVVIGPDGEEMLLKGDVTVMR